MNPAEDDEDIAPTIPSADTDTACPICLETEAQVAACAGHHRFCRRCIERLLYHPPPRDDDDEGLPLVPCLGQCPICRSSMSVFDLMDTSGHYPYRQTGWSVLEGAIYVEARPYRGAAAEQGVGYGSFHFDTNPPTFNLELVPRWSKDHPMTLPLTDVYWNADTSTVTGRIVFSKSPYHEWRIYLSFSSDLRFVRRGAILKQRRREPSTMERYYPLDGEYESDHSSRQVEVESMSLVFRGEPHVIKIHRDDHKMELVNALRMTTVRQAAWDFGAAPAGPRVGNTILWTKPSDAESVMKWTCTKKSTEIPPDDVQYIGGTSARMYRRLASTIPPTERMRPVYHADGIIGNVFCQFFKVGLASYHFVSESEVYISYDNLAATSWPPLDNGMPVPSRVSFHNIDFADAHTFRGSICWLDDYGTTWQRMARWEYEMTFDTEYMGILGGRVVSYTPSGEESELSRFGESLVYMNAGLYDEFVHRRRQSYHDFQQLSTALRTRLLEEGAPVRVAATIHRVLTIAQQPGVDSPIDYNLA